MSLSYQNTFAQSTFKYERTPKNFFVRTVYILMRTVKPALDLSLPKFKENVLTFIDTRSNTNVMNLTNFLGLPNVPV